MGEGGAGVLHREQSAMPSGLSLSVSSHTNPSSASASYINTEVKPKS
jgi:hypothetical protein